MTDLSILSEGRFEIGPRKIDWETGLELMRSVMHLNLPYVVFWGESTPLECRRIVRFSDGPFAVQRMEIDEWEDLSLHPANEDGLLEAFQKLAERYEDG